MARANATPSRQPGEYQNRIGAVIPGLLQTLHLLPLKYRWEFTRRHPYYLQFWELAHRHYAGLLTDPQEARWGQLAAYILLGIGVSGDPPPPTSGPDALQLNQLASAWHDGAAAPLTYLVRQRFN